MNMLILLIYGFEILIFQKLFDCEIYFTFCLFKGSCGNDSTLLHDGVRLYLYLRVNSLYFCKLQLRFHS